jgi:hypothetical protein
MKKKKLTSRDRQRLADPDTAAATIPKACFCFCCFWGVFRPQSKSKSAWDVSFPKADQLRDWYGYGASRSEQCRR